MCGGPGSRLDARVEKPLFEVGGRPMVDRVADALAGSRIETTHAVVSLHAPETGEHVRDDLGFPTIETPGDGYVEDLGAALDQHDGDTSVLTVVADLPLLEADVVDGVLDRYAGGPGGSDATASLAVYVPAALKRQLGVSVDESTRKGGRELAPTGLNVVGPAAGSDGERVHVSLDARLAVNVNRSDDAEAAEALL